MSDHQGLPQTRAADATPPNATLALLQSQLQLHQDLVDALPMQLVVYEIVARDEIRLIMANRPLLEMSGFAASELVGKRPSEFFPADEAARALRTVQECVDRGGPIESTVEVELPHGRRWLQCACLPIRNR